MWLTHGTVRLYIGQVEFTWGITRQSTPHTNYVFFLSLPHSPPRVRQEVVWEMRAPGKTPQRHRWEPQHQTCSNIDGWMLRGRHTRTLRNLIFTPGYCPVIIRDERCLGRIGHTVKLLCFTDQVCLVNVIGSGKCQSGLAGILLDMLIEKLWDTRLHLISEWARFSLFTGHL